MPTKKLPSKKKVVPKKSIWVRAYRIVWSAIKWLRSIAKCAALWCVRHFKKFWFYT